MVVLVIVACVLDRLLQNEIEPQRRLRRLLHGVCLSRALAA